MTADCLIGEGNVDAKGYARIRIGKQMVLAHRAVYEAQYGPIPEGSEVHHECRCRRCMNPHHLALLPAGAHKGLHSTKEFCCRGHRLSETRHLSPNGTVKCAECHRIRKRQKGGVPS